MLTKHSLLLLLLIIIIIRLPFVVCLNKKNLARKHVTEESKAIINKQKLNKAASQ